VQDRLRITANQTGGQTISMADTQGNFLAATGVLAASQTLGQNAILSIDSVNGGQAFTSASNTITGMVAGVVLELKATSATPVTVTVSQNSQAAVDVIKEFVNRINQTLDTIAANTSYDAKTKKGQPLTGDSGIAFIEQSLRSLVNSPGLGLSGSYKNLATIGVSTGAVGTAVGKATRLLVDETKLNAALKENPQAVEALIGSFSATLGAPSGPGNVTAVSGTPLNQHVSGTYYVKVLDGTGKAEARLVTADGQTVFTSTGTLTAGQDNTILIPGVKLTVAGTLNVGEDSFAVTVNTRGVVVQLKDTVDGWLGSTGYFANRESAAQAASSNLNKQMAVMEDRVKQREAALTRKFSALEVALARLQTQSAGLSASIARLAASSSR
jgi:flagellar hook-associated protein 2